MSQEQPGPRYLEYAVAQVLVTQGRIESNQTAAIGILQQISTQLSSLSSEVRGRNAPLEQSSRSGIIGDHIQMVDRFLSVGAILWQWTIWLMPRVAIFRVINNLAAAATGKIDILWHWVGVVLGVIH